MLIGGVIDDELVTLQFSTMRSRSMERKSSRVRIADAHLIVGDVVAVIFEREDRTHQPDVLTPSADVFEFGGQPLENPDTVVVGVEE